MRVLGLLFSLLVLAVFGPVLLLAIGIHDFSWKSVLLFLVPAAIVYFIVRTVGISLDRQFNACVKDFTDGKAAELVCGKGLKRIFGLLLITLFPFLVYLELFALVLAVSFTMYGMWLLSLLERVPIAIILGLILVALLTGYAILLGFYYLLFPPKPKSTGIAIGPENPKVWKVVNEVAEQVGSRAISKILINSDAGIGVYLEGNMLTRLVGRGRRVLEIGVLGLHDLQVEEFKSILAHEYGHFAHRDTQWSWFVYSMSSSLLGTMRTMPGPRSGEGLVGGVMAINPAFWALLLFTNLFFRITNGFSRTREVMADLLAMKLYGGETFRNALLKVSVAGHVSSRELPLFALKAERENKTFPGLWQLSEGAFTTLSESELEAVKAKALEDGASHGDYDSHPALQVRIDYSNRIGGGECAVSEAATGLFDTWDTINAQLISQYSKTMLPIFRQIEPTLLAEKGKEMRRLDTPIIDRPAIRHALNFDCSVRTKLGGDKGIFDLLRDSERAEALSAMSQSTCDHDGETIVVINEAVGGEQKKISETYASTIIERAEKLNELESQCRECPANYLGRACGCAGSVHYPITSVGEEWMLCQLPDDLEETPRGKSIIDSISASCLDVEVDKARVTPGRYELNEPHTYTWEVNGCDFPITSSHMVGNLLHADEFTPNQGSALCYHLGAINAAPGGSEKPSWVWNIDEFSDDKSVRELAWMVRGLYQGYILGINLHVKQ